jgi:hypothetical protein
VVDANEQLRFPDRPPVDPEAVASGPPISPTVRIRTYTSGQWEEFIEEWVHSLTDRYSSVERVGGPGDMGRDVIGHRHDGGWDNHQCKHYDHPLRPSDAWIELGKLMFYASTGRITAPTAYQFVAPQGAGNTFAALLRRPDELRARLLDNWDSHCRTKITTVRAVELTPDLRDYIAAFDFSVVGYVTPFTIIDGHRRTRYFAARFGGGLPPRPEPPHPPEEPAQSEAVYVRALLRAYGEHCSRLFADVAALSSDDAATTLHDHFRDARREFYSAEALRSFSRDSLPPGEFARLQQQVRDGVIDVVRMEHDSGYRRALAVVAAAKTMPLDSHALKSRINPRDRGGICHQLVNDGRFQWVE